MRSVDINQRSSFNGFVPVDSANSWGAPRMVSLLGLFVGITTISELTPRLEVSMLCSGAVMKLVSDLHLQVFAWALWRQRLRTT